MTLIMGDGPVANLPPGLDAYAGYVNRSGIGITYPGVVAAFPNAKHLSITTDGSRAQCADVETGAMSDWSGYAYGYCSVSKVNTMVQRYGRPRKLWTAHQDPRFGAHICGPKTCNYGGNLATAADATQWIDHNGLWDESLLADDFFSPLPAPAPPTPVPPTKEPSMFTTDPQSGGTWSTDANGDLYNEFGAPFVQGLNQHPEYHAGSAESGGANPCVGIAACKDSTGAWGLVYFTNNGSRAADGSAYHTYRFHRDGSPD